MSPRAPGKAWRIQIARPAMGAMERSAVERVLASGVLARGPEVAALEREFARACRASHAVALSNGTTALHAALHALGLRPGDEVITTPFTFIATANAILLQGCKPVFADIREETFDIDPEAVAEAVTPRTKALLPVDLYGQLHDWKAIREIARERSIPVLDDACQAVGASLDGGVAGSLAEATAFSLYATKNITAGEGGIVTTENAALAESIRRFRNHGQRDGLCVELGTNYRMTEIQAAIARVQLRRLSALTRRRIENARYLMRRLSGVRGLRLPVVKPGARHVFHQFTVRVEGSPRERDRLAEHLRARGVECAVFYPRPVHLQPLYRDLGHREGECPVAERAAGEVLSLPVHPGLTRRDLDRMADLLERRP